MVASLDGSTAVDGRSGALSSPNDTEVLLSLRAVADTIIVGAGTVRDEGYGAPSKDGQRIGVVTNSGRLDLTTPLFTSGAGFLICPRSLPPMAVDTLRTGHDTVDLVEAVGRLDELAPGSTFVQAEGGSVLNGALSTAGLIDEINLTMSPRIVGGDGPRLTSRSPEHVTDYELAHLLTDEAGFLFTRWLRPPSG